MGRGRGRVSSRTPSLSFSARVLLRTAFDGRHCAQVVTTGVSCPEGRGPLKLTFSASRGSVQLPAGDTDRAPRHSGPRRASGWRPSASSRPACLSRSRRPRGTDPGTLGGWTDCDWGGGSGQGSPRLSCCPGTRAGFPAAGCCPSAALEVDFLFVALGHRPDSHLVQEGQEQRKRSPLRPSCGRDARPPPAPAP